MNILVAGAGGFIAGHLVKSLALQGYDVTAVDIKSQDKWFQVHDLKNVETVPKSDLRDKRVVKSLLKKRKYTRIYNLACNMGRRLIL